MRALLAPLQELGEYEELKKILGKEKAAVSISGCVDSEKLHMIYGLGDGFRNKIIVTFSDLKTKELYEEVSFNARGRLSVKTAPMPGLLCTKMLPPCPSGSFLPVS